MRLWADALELPMSAVGVDDDFFALGGDSLRGAGVVARIRDLLGRPEIPLISIVRSPTVAAMAAELMDDEPPPSGTLVPFRDGPGRKLFFVHGGFGDLLGYAALASRLPAAIELVGIQPPEAAGGPPGPDDFPSMAGDYVEAVREAQARRPVSRRGTVPRRADRDRVGAQARRRRRGGERHPSGPSDATAAGRAVGRVDGPSPAT